MMTVNFCREHFEYPWAGIPDLTFYLVEILDISLD
jgi:hypothetical protein